MKILGTICARGGSKGVRNKNIRLLNGKPLIYYAIEALRVWGRADRIILSTDSIEIQKLAKKCGAETPFLRPVELATDSADKLDVWKHMHQFCEKEDNIKYDYIVDLDPTSPLRLISDIEQSFNKLLNSDADLLFSVYQSHKNPYFNMVELDKNNYAHICKKPENKIVARQQAPKVYSLNASIYVMRREFLVNTDCTFCGINIIHEMPDLSIDIDREIDFEFIEFILKKRFFEFDY